MSRGFVQTVKAPWRNQLPSSGVFYRSSVADLTCLTWRMLESGEGVLEAVGVAEGAVEVEGGVEHFGGGGYFGVGVEE
jgi:hypothetical protein